MAFLPGDHMRLEMATLAATRKPDHPGIAAPIAAASLRRAHGVNPVPAFSYQRGLTQTRNVKVNEELKLPLELEAR